MFTCDNLNMSYWVCIYILCLCYLSFRLMMGMSSSNGGMTSFSFLSITRLFHLFFFFFVLTITFLLFESSGSVIDEVPTVTTEESQSPSSHYHADQHIALTETKSPWPPVVHQSISLSTLILSYEQEQEQQHGDDIYSIAVIGDVHGCLNELKSLIELLEMQSSTYREKIIAIVFVGDIIAKGPKSVETVQYIREKLSLKYPFVTSVRGNHEDNLLIAYANPINSKFKDNPMINDMINRFSSSDIEWLQNLPITLYINELELLIVHAGVKPRRKNNEEYNFKNNTSYNNYIRMRSVDAATFGTPTKRKPTIRYSGSKEEPSSNSEPNSNESGTTENVRWGLYHHGPPFIVFGHAARERLQDYEWALGIDTAAVYGDKLSAVVIPFSRHTSGNRPNIWKDRKRLVSVKSECRIEKY